MQVAADEPPREQCAQLELESSAVVVRPVDGEHVGAGVACCDGCRLAADGGEHDRFEAGRSRGRCNGVTEVAGRRAAERGHAVVERGRDRDRGKTILVRARRIRILELEPQIDVERLREMLGPAQRRPAGPVLELRAPGEQAVVAPERLRPRGDRLVRDETGDALPVVGHVRGAVAAPAGVDRLGRCHLLAHAATQCEGRHRASPSRRRRRRRAAGESWRSPRPASPGRRAGARRHRRRRR